jgi:glycosyltransferase involved in cell wall biosynthesis
MTMSTAWHVLDVRCVWIREFARALAEESSVIGWLPRLSWIAAVSGQERGEIVDRVEVREFPLQRGFVRWPVTALVDEGARIARRLHAADPASGSSPLILASPHYHGVAARWSGPAIYYATDMFRFCDSDPARIERLEREMCRHADLVCPNSRRIADYMIETLGVHPDRVVIVPNATRLENIAPERPAGPEALPDDCRDLPRPVAGIIGNLAINTDWEFLEGLVDRTPWLSWVFVGPATWNMPETRQSAARSRLVARNGRVRFVGEQPYGLLRDYARGFDVAVLPYRRREPTYSGSSTRYFEHLAAARPMIATRAVHQLLDKEPLLTLVDSVEDAARHLDRLRKLGFRDGFEQLRWQVSRGETLQARVSQMTAALVERGLLPGADPSHDCHRGRGDRAIRAEDREPEPVAS